MLETFQVPRRGGASDEAAAVGTARLRWARRRLLLLPCSFVSVILLAPGAFLPAAAAAQAGPPPERGLSAKSIAIYVGADLTEDGSVLLGGFGHEPSSHWLEVTPAASHPEGATIEVGVTEDARLPGERMRIPQVERTRKYVTTNYSEFAGFPPPLTNGGLNASHVAARDVWSPSREELVEMTPRPQRGLNYSDISRIVMERAETAREAVEIAGALIDEHGYATYGGNSHLFADPEEAWVFIDYAGGRGLWAAERLGPDEVRVSYPGYIGDFPVDFQERDGFMASANLVHFAVEQGWWDPEGDETFNLQRVYGRPFPADAARDDPFLRFRDPPRLEEEIRAMAPVSLADMLALVRDPRWSDDAAGYGQVAHLRREVPEDLGVLWMSITGAVASPFVPVHLGVEDVPPEYKQHRYMTKGADRAFLDPDYAALEATRSAFRVHKRLLYHTCGNPETFLPRVTAELEGFERMVLEELPGLEREAEALQSGGDGAEARELLTTRSQEWLMAALALGETLVSRVEVETRERFGIRMPAGDAPGGASWRPESQEMTLRPGRLHVSCFVEGWEEYPREHGGYEELEGSLTGGGPAPDGL